MECMWKVYEQLVDSFRAQGGRSARCRHGRAATMGCRSGEVSSGCFRLGKSGWLGSWRRGGAHLLVGLGARGPCIAGRRGHPLSGLVLPPPVSASREGRGAQGVWGKGRGPTRVLHGMLAAGAHGAIALPYAWKQRRVFSEGKRRKGAEGRRKVK